ncbi:hypothetical protein EsDP_00006748 [Epichloe bromicola]|uniref:Amidase domain-containing protein n=1 Tax=Epichloe bromicola TaxID=79588 RepID=A0ABQ0CYN1_9HYPO
MASSSPLFLSAHELAGRLSTNQTTSAAIASAFLDHIASHNHEGKCLNALISVAPRGSVLAQAAALDDERANGRLRSALHGVPIVVKDCFLTDESLGMTTSAGAAVFATMRSRGNAVAVQRVRLIILGKGNMTEFSGMKSDDTPVGWSAHGGMSRSAYRKQGLDEQDQPTAGGSSSGPTVSVSAGFAPLAVGTETAGSAVYPASVNGVYGLKLSFGSVPMDGVCKLSASFDHVGIFARDPVDLGPLADILMGGDAGASGHRAAGAARGFEGLRVGVVANTWGVGEKVAREKWDTPELKDAYESAVQRLRSLVRKVAHPLDVPKAEDVLKYDGETLRSVAYAEFPRNIQEFISCFHPVRGITCLEDIVDWNEEHADVALPKPYTTQTELIAATRCTMTGETCAEVAAQLGRLATAETMGKMMDEHALDVVLSNSDAALVSYASCAGWPVAAVPLGRMTRSGQPFGMFAIARHGGEDVLLTLMRAWDDVFGPCEGPDMDVGDLDSR